MIKPTGQIFSYLEYRQWMGNLVALGKTTGENTDELIAYTKLNEQRMSRWDKTGKISDEFKTAIQSIKTPQTWYIITEPWCGDASQNLIWFHLAELENPNIQVKLILRDENPEIMNQFLTNGGKAIPKVVFVKNEDQSILGDWGPRPAVLQEKVNDLRRQIGLPKEKLYEEIHGWYAKDKGAHIQNEIIELISRLI